MLLANPNERYANIIRYVVFGIWMLKFSIDPLQDLADLPLTFFKPPFPLNTIWSDSLSVLLTPSALITLRVLGFLSCVFCLRKRYIPYAGFVASVSIVVYQCTVRGFGHTNHAEVVVMIAVFIYAVSSVIKQRASQPEPLAIAFVLCFSYTLIAAHRFAFGGIELFASDTLSYWVANNANLLSYFQFRIGAQLTGNEIVGQLLKISFVWVSLCELLAPLALVIPRVRIPLFLSLLGFHAGVLLLMNILFWENTVLLIVLFAPSIVKNSLKANLL